MRFPGLLCVPFVLFAACQEPAPHRGAPPIDTHGPFLPVEGDCDLSTPLVPGVPGSPGHLIVSPRNPNGESELASLMRHFVDDLRDVRTLLEAGQPVPKLWPVHRRMRCAWPTKAGDRSEPFDQRAQAYLSAVQMFDASPAPSTYNAMIIGCIACHSQSCGGPLEFIDSMLWR